MSANVCPFIATGADSSKRSSGPSAAHSCFATRPAEPINLQRQSDTCLTPTFTACPIFLAWASREAAQTIDAPAPQPLPFGTPAASAPVDLAAATLGIDEVDGEYEDLPEGSIWSTAPAPGEPRYELSPTEEERVRLVPLHKRRSMDDEAPRAALRLPKIPGGTRGAAALLVLAAVILFSLPTILKGVNGFIAGVTATPSPSASPTSDVSPSPTPTPTAESLIYRVKSGDTLGKIAERFQVSIEVIMSVNPEITRPELIRVGQDLIIPQGIPDVVTSPSP
ncbi:MAG: LysM peptidoglycan-binding domain-containing protein [Chloroflexi bacterium]|nr:LysM peptidoglycan-binding domain-containing protein [Chloroflexota bacterium]